MEHYEDVFWFTVFTVILLMAIVPMMLGIPGGNTFTSGMTVDQEPFELFQFDGDLIDFFVLIPLVSFSQFPSLVHFLIKSHNFTSSKTAIYRDFPPVNAPPL